MKHSLSFRFALAGIFILLCSLLISANAFAAVDAFLKLEGVNGEGTFKCKIDEATGDCIFKDVKPGTYKVTLMGSAEYFSTWGVLSGASSIEISSFSWGVSNSSATTGSGLGTGKVSYSDLSVMKKSDKSSPKLSETVAGAPMTGGFTHKRCTLAIRKQGTEQQDYYMVTLQDIVITNNATSLGDGNGRINKAGYDVKTNVKF